MALNPDDLLIFKVREEEEEKEDLKKTKKPQEKAPEKPQKVKETRKPVQAKEPDLEQEYAEKEELEMPEAPKPQIEQTFEPIPEIENSPSPDEYVNMAMRNDSGRLEDRYTGKTLASKKRMNSRKMAEHLSCELHPWRRAYAICDYCKRAFCYEDIIEMGGKYYDLDDIDKVPVAARRAQAVKYNNLGLFAAVLYMLAFVVFIYYAYSEIGALFNVLVKVGLLTFVNDISPTRIFLLSETVLSACALVAGILVLLNVRNSFRLGAIVSIIGVVVFSYQYLDQGLLYFLIFDALVFVGFITLAYSRVSYETLDEEENALDTDVTLGAAHGS